MNMRHNYLNNKDILKEIAKSKNTFCSYLEEFDAEYDIILPELKKLNKTNIMNGRRARAERLAKKAHEVEVKKGIKAKLADFAVNVRDVPATDVVFRVTTWDHVPQEVIKRKPKNNKEQQNKAQTKNNNRITNCTKQNKQKTKKNTNRNKTQKKVSWFMWSLKLAPSCCY